MAARYLVRHAMFTTSRLAHVAQLHATMYATRVTLLNTLEASHPAVYALVAPFTTNIIGYQCSLEPRGDMTGGLSKAGLRLSDDSTEVLFAENAVVADSLAAPLLQFDHTRSVELSGLEDLLARLPDPEAARHVNIDGIWETTIGITRTFVSLHYDDDDTVASDDALVAFVAELLAHRASVAASVHGRPTWERGRSSPASSLRCPPFDVLLSRLRRSCDAARGPRL